MIRGPARGTALIAMALIPALMLSGPALAQESPHFKIKAGALNAGGRPEAGAAPASAAFQLRPEAIGQNAVGPDPSSVSYRLPSGSLLSFPPPAEVQGLEFLDPVTLQWDPDPFARHYHLYRTDPMGVPTGVAPLGGCAGPDIAAKTTTDTDVPPLERAFFYFVAGVNCNLVEGPAGPIGTRCP